MTQQFRSKPKVNVTRPRTPVRTRLMTGGAMAACLTALVSHAPAQAFSSAFQGIANVVNPGTATVSQNPGVDTITVTAPQAVINWTPFDRGSSGTIDFLPFGSTGRFIGTQEFTVLNRIIPLDGNDLPIARLIALNGTIESLILDPLSGATSRGGSVWFYSPGGILVGSGATINVGNLVLSARDIDTSGGLFGPTGEIRFRDPSVAGAGASTITIAPGAQIFASRATGANSYIAMVAPRIEQRGTVQADGSVALIAAERADVRINAGLFDINVLVGTSDANGIVHTGNTGGILDAAGGHVAYMVAVPKNQAMTMLLSGTIGFVPGQSASMNAQGNIVISAGRNAAGGTVGDVVNGNTTGSVNISDSIFLNSLEVGATNNITVRPQGDCAPFCSPFGTFGQVQFRGNATLTADRTLNMSIGNAQRIVADRDLVLRAGTPGQGGTVELGIDNIPPSSPSSTGGGVISVTGALVLDASARGTTSVNNGAASGGFARLSVVDGTLTAGTIDVSANGIGGVTAAGNGATGTGGTAIVTTGTDGAINASVLSVQANGRGNDQFLNIGGNGVGGQARVLPGGGTIAISQLLDVQATGSGTLGATRSGNGTGGLAEITVGATAALTTPLTVVNVSGFAGSDDVNLSSAPQTTIGGTGNGGQVLIRSDGNTNLGDLFVSADGFGSASFADESGSPGSGGDATGGEIDLLIFAGTTNIGDLQMSATANAGSSGNATGATGAATGGRIQIQATTGAQLVNRSGATLNASAFIDTSGGGAVGAAIGGSIFLVADNSALITSTSTWELFANADATVGAGQPAARSAGQANGGEIEIASFFGGTIDIANVNVEANAVAAHAVATGGNATGGRILVQADIGGSVIFDETGSNFSANGTAGSGQAGGTGTGGNIEFFVSRDSTIDLASFTNVNAAGRGGQSFDGMSLGNGVGGTISILVTDDLENLFSFDDLFLFASGETAIGGEGFVNLGDGAESRGGTVNLRIEGGSVVGRSLSLSATGEGSGRGSGFGGLINFDQTGGNATIQFLSLVADGLSNNILFSDVGGSGTGGEINMNLTGGQLLSDFLFLGAQGRGGDGLSAFSNAVFIGGEGGQPFMPDIYGGFAGPFVTGQYNAPGIGGDGTGGTIRVRLSGDAVLNIRTDFGFQAIANGIGGEGGSVITDLVTPARTPGMGGRGTGGTIEFIYESGELRGNGMRPSLALTALGIGGEGGRLFVDPNLDCNFFDCGAQAGEDFTLPTAESGPMGGQGQGGTVNVTLLGTLDNAIIQLDSSGVGGRGGLSLTGGRGGDGVGGTSTLFIDNIDGGSSIIELISEGRGGFGGDGINGAGGDGGQGRGGNASLLVSGLDAVADTDRLRFAVNGRGGRGGNAFVSPFSATIPTTGGSGGNGGDGYGGSIELRAINSNLLIGMSGEGAEFGSRGIGGDAGSGADNSAGPANEARFGGNAGFGGAGFGGTVALIADGGSIAVFQGASVDIDVTGIGGEGGSGGAGNVITLFDMMGNPIGTSGGSGFFTGRSFNGAGIIRLEANDDGENLGRISLNDAFFEASGDIGGRIELIDNSAGAGLEFGRLTALAFGGPVVSGDFTIIGSGIYIRSSANPITVLTSAELFTDGSIQIDGRDTGGLDVGDSFIAAAQRDFTTRHDDRPEGQATVSAETVQVNADFIDIQPGSLLRSDDFLSLSATSLISFDRLVSLDGDIRLFATFGGRITGNEADASGNILIDSDFDVVINSLFAGEQIRIDVNEDGALANIGSAIAVEQIDISSYGSINLGFASGSGIDLEADDFVTFGDLFGGNFVSIRGNDGVTGDRINADQVTVNSSVGDIDIDRIDATDFIRLDAGGAVRGGTAEAEFGFIQIFAGSVDYGSLFAGGEGGITITATGNVTLDRAVTTTNDPNQETGLPAGVQGQLAVTPGDFDVSITSGGVVTFNEIEAEDSVFIIAASIAGAGSSIFANAGISTNTTGNSVLGELETTSGDIDLRAGGTLTADLARIGSSGGAGTFSGTNGVTIDTVRIPGTSSFTASNGAVLVRDLRGGLVNALGRSVDMTSTDTVGFGSVESTAGNVRLFGSSGNITVNTGRASGDFDARTSNGALSVGRVDATNIFLQASTTAALTGAVTAGTRLDVRSSRATTVTGSALGNVIEMRSGDMVIGANGRIGAVGTTSLLTLINSDNAARTFIGGNDQAGEYSLSSAEMARLFGNNILIRAPRVSAQGGGALGLTRPPDVVIGAFTFTGGGGTGANLGASGTLRIETPGFARVVGAADFSNMAATNGFELDARESIEVILGQGSIRLSGSGANGLGGTLSLFSDDIVVGTSTAITAIAGLTDLSAVDDRLAQNDGVTSDDGALTANAIDLFVTNGVYIQNSGLSDKFGDRRGFTTNSLGITAQGGSATGSTPNNIRIVINGRIGDSTNVLRTGIDAIALAVINDVSGGTAGGFDSLSTINGCVIANPSSCSVRFDTIFPVRDVIEEEVEDDEDSPGDGADYQSLITIRENDRSREDPLLDEPVTGSGNDDLWIPSQ